MAVGLGPLPTLHPVAGFELGIASAGIKRPGRKDVVVMRCAEGSTVAGVFTLNAIACITIFALILIKRVSYALSNQPGPSQRLLQPDAMIASIHSTKAR